MVKKRKEAIELEYPAIDDVYNIGLNLKRTYKKKKEVNNEDTDFVDYDDYGF